MQEAPMSLPAEAVQAASVPPELKVILDRAAGKEHSQHGPVMRCLAEILAVHGRMVAEHIARAIEANVRNEDHAKQDRGRWVGFECRMAYVDGHDKAARLAREAFPKGDNRDQA